MYSVLNNIFSDKKDGLLFECFGIWHVGYIVLFVIISLFCLCYLKNKDSEKKKHITKLFSDIAFGILIADFFFMPLAYGEIDIEKLPFHICTSMCVMSFLSYRIEFFKKYKTAFAVLGLLSNLGYLIYPAGLMWHQTHPLSYRVIETLVFHGVMTVHGILVFAYEVNERNLKKCYRDLFVIIVSVAWAILGNYTYNGDYANGTRFFNWFFVVCDPFYILPEEISPFVMPVLNTVMFFTLELVLYSLVWKIKRNKR